MLAPAFYIPPPSGPVPCVPLYPHSPPASGDGILREPVPTEGQKGGNDVERTFYLK